MLAAHDHGLGDKGFAFWGRRTLTSGRSLGRGGVLRTRGEGGFVSDVYFLFWVVPCLNFDVDLKVVARKPRGGLNSNLGKLRL
jgi:hypothetical protein